MEGSDCESLDDASVSWFPGITRTNMELPLLLVVDIGFVIGIAAHPSLESVDPGFPFRLTPMSFALRVTNSP